MAAGALNGREWPAALRSAGAVVAALLLRVLCFSLPHSGQRSLPIGGDFEAQRHWCELTRALPLAEWYAPSRRNDLAYWGLDYPPLSAFFARAVAAAAPPALVAFRNSSLAAARAAAADGRPYVYGDGDGDGEGSNGHGGGGGRPRLLGLSHGKLFMRLSVVASEAIALLPACVALARELAPAPQRPLLFFLLVAQPALLLVDHGHFQYNGVTIGLSLGAAAAATGNCRGGMLLAALLFALALNFKQTALYYAPAFFAFLLAACLTCGTRVVVRGATATKAASTRPPSWPDAIAAVAALGAVVLAVFAALWWPFCAFPAPGASCADGLSAVWLRIFPLARNIFEDKVANAWCTLEPLLRLRQRLDGRVVRAGSGHEAVVLLCGTATLLAILPSLVLLAQRWLVCAPLSLPALAPPDQTLKWPRRDPPQRRRQSTSAPASAASSSSTPFSAFALAASSSSAPTASVSALPGNSAGEPCWLPPSLLELLLLALFNVSLGFFLFSFQVHEKSILLPLMPMQALALRLPLLSSAFSLAALVSLGPMLAKDGLLLLPLPYALAALHFACALQLGGATEGDAGEGVALQVALRQLGCCGCRGLNAGRLQRGLRWCGRAFACAALLLALAVAFVAPPPRLPDLFAYLSAVLCACGFSGFLVVGTLVLWAWVNGEGARRRGRRREC